MTLYRYGKQKYIQIALLLFVFFVSYTNLNPAEISRGFKIVTAIIFAWQLYRLGANITIYPDQLAYRFFGVTYKTIALKGLDYQAPALKRKFGSKPFAFFSHHHEIGIYEGNHQVHQLSLNTGAKKS
ncbi:hypothetical protein [Brochothrix campestris]|uniref:Uncharacterized protein n=1 Tax=Brochothrix campestris FSL F6-1037 TaxID=1265861 RepID=W7CW34_9LIST|nr:hypothetical protein [Brochothrix campestris]EUJ41147.1 hypothetical protein BCAMP_04005 [Brochothrix campestris FSL F6-1037]